MKMELLLAMGIFCLVGNVQAGLFETIDSVGVIQSKDTANTNREPAAAPNASATAVTDEEHAEEPNVEASQKVEKTSTHPSKKKSNKVK